MRQRSKSFVFASPLVEICMPPLKLINLEDTLRSFSPDKGLFQIYNHCQWRFSSTHISHLVSFKFTYKNK